MIEQITSIFLNFIRRFQKILQNQWDILSDRSEIAFNWPVNCPLEVMELVGRERFNANNPKYMMPFFWMSEPVPATRSWGIIVCAIEWMFGLICLLFNILHFGIYLPKYKGNGIPGTVFFVTLIQFSIFYANKVLFIIALIEKRVRLLKQQLIFQYATSVILLINVSFTVAADAGGYDEQNLYASKNPILIRFVAFLSFIFIFVQLFLRWMTVSVYSFLRDTRRFIQAVENSMLRYRKRVFFTYCSIVFENTQNMKKPKSLREIVDNQQNAVYNQLMMNRTPTYPILNSPMMQSDFSTNQSNGIIGQSNSVTARRKRSRRYPKRNAILKPAARRYQHKISIPNSERPTQSAENVAIETKSLMENLDP